MRIVIDLQGAQSSGSRHRGIGRYSLWLSQAMARNAGPNEIVIVLSDLFPDTIEPLRAAFDGLLPPANVVVWRAPGPVAHLSSANDWRRRTAELMREAFLACLAPDFVLVTSLFEGLTDDAVTSVGRHDRSVPTAVILYDLIPLIHRNHYLANPDVATWYEGKLDHLRRADLTLAISESSRDEGMRYLGLADDECVAISTATDPRFRPLRIGADREARLRAEHGLDRPFVMYTGGIDHRKNIGGLIRAYARLPASLRAEHRLAVVCAVQPSEREHLASLARAAGLHDGDLVLTGFVSDNDLLALYNLCKLFVFPSWHEGFGLPALEAMACGRAVIGADSSSIPEVIGRDDALFDAHDDAAMARAIGRALSDDAFRRSLEQHGLEQSKRFGWDISARRALDAMVRWREAHAPALASPQTPQRRPKLAYVSPLPPERSGISDFSAELLPELSRHYEIDVVVAQGDISDTWIRENCAVRTVDEFRAHADHYARVVYQFGNSAFHQHMFDLLTDVPGVVVLHDFYLSGIAAHMDLSGAAPGTWARWLHASHGYHALQRRFATEDAAEVIYQFPANLGVLQSALGVVVHSQTSVELVKRWYGEHAASGWTVLPLLRTRAAKRDRAAARARLQLTEEAFVVCSFGMIGPTKLSHRLLEAWLASPLATEESCHLVFVGQNDSNDYGRDLASRIAGSAGAERIRVTGWADIAQFRDHLVAADVGVQLRTLTRGETSAAVLDCMNHGLATIANAHGSMAELEAGSFAALPDEFTTRELATTLEALWRDDDLRHALGRRGSEVVHTRHNPRRCAQRYRDAIEAAYARAAFESPGLCQAIGDEADPPDAAAWSEVAKAVAFNHPPRPRLRQLLLDISGLRTPRPANLDTSTARDVLRQWLARPPAGFRVEPVHAGVDVYHYARRDTLDLLGCNTSDLRDDAVEPFPGDVFIALCAEPRSQAAHAGWIRAIRRAGIHVAFVVHRVSPETASEPEAAAAPAEDRWPPWLDLVAEADTVMCSSRSVADDLFDWLQVHGAGRDRALGLHCVPFEFDGAATDPTPTRYADRLLAAALHGQPYRQWMPDGVDRLLGGDTRLRTQVGRRDGTRIATTGAEGYLLFGPYLSLPAGRYEVRLWGSMEEFGDGAATVEAVAEGGTQRLGLANPFASELSAATLCMLVRFPVELAKRCRDFEVRVWVSATISMAVSMLEIAPLETASDNDLLESTADLEAMPGSGGVAAAGHTADGRSSAVSEGAHISPIA